jgi:DNA-binding PadR family transcriptional regulator|tara:strand:- start:292 stop:780 length:489 start_codon:yes stop_codon:yes gene_type:complete
MIESLLNKVGSAIPRGFSRYFLLEALKEKSLTGKQIIDLASEKTGGRWSPSPGLIYPLIGRLLDEGLIEEVSDGKYKISKKGKTTLGELDSFNDYVKKQLDVVFRLANIGEFLASDMIERVTTLGNLLSSNVGKMTSQETEKYRNFLKSELEKLEKSTKSKK